MRAIAVTLSLAVPAPAAADLVHRHTIPDVRAVSLAYDARLCAFWVADESATLTLFSVDGRVLERIPSTMRFVRSLTTEENGLLLADGWGDFRRIDRRGNPIDAPFSLSATIRDTEGIHRDADGSFLVVEDDPSRLLRIAPDGTVLMSLNGETFTPPMTEPQGITRDPYSGNILVVDDNEGLNALFELAPDGRVISVTPLSQWGYDAEGVALQPESGTLFVGYDAGRAIAIFDWQPTEITIDAPLERGPDCGLM